MPETDLSTVVILIGACAGLLFLILVGVIMAGARLGRIERLLAHQKGSGRVENPSTESRQVIDSRSSGAFERFLEQDPAIKLLSKKEQSAAYRKWRQEQGMNWSNS